MSRREFVGTAVGLAASAAAVTTTNAQPAPDRSEAPLIISTWPFGKASNDEALKVLSNGGSLLDAVEKGIWVTENDLTNKSVGLGGTPNAAGFTQLDSCIMFGPGHKAGSVAAIEGIRHPISAARLVMEKSPHAMIVGEGARLFALEHGLESAEEYHRDLYDKFAKAHPPITVKKADNHDTIALLILGSDGTIVGGCSTSGLGGKLPGRVGDSPIFGSGLYVDNEVGAAGATGIGENVMRYCASFMIVEFMRQGSAPHEAIKKAIKRIVDSEKRPASDLHINFVALDKHGRFAGAGTDDSFKFSVTTTSKSSVVDNLGA